MRKGIHVVGVGALLLAMGTAQAATTQQQCQSAKNKAAGKYAVCRQNAAAKLATAPADTQKYNDALAKCDSKYTSAWQKAIDKATAANVVCPDAPLTVVDFRGAINAHTDIIKTALEGGGLVDCPADLVIADGGICHMSAQRMVMVRGNPRARERHAQRKPRERSYV